eukprot:982702-Ditylum_brightwellii.AAC.1
MEHYQKKICHLNQKSNRNWMTQNLQMKMNIRNTNTSLGVGQWLVVSGRLDITHAVSLLSRLSAMPRVGHLKLARKILGYLKNYP